jgi:hypothetical protein
MQLILTQVAFWAFLVFAIELLIPAQIWAVMKAADRKGTLDYSFENTFRFSSQEIASKSFLYIVFLVLFLYQNPILAALYGMGMGIANCVYIYLYKWKLDR